MDASVDHGITFDAQKEGGEFVVHQQLIEIQPVFHIVIGG
jgi:hypothetical protein